MHVEDKNELWRWIYRKGAENNVFGPDLNEPTISAHLRWSFSNQMDWNCKISFLIFVIWWQDSRFFSNWVVHGALDMCEQLLGVKVNALFKTIPSEREEMFMMTVNYYNIHYYIHSHTKLVNFYLNSSSSGPEKKL